MILNNLKLNNFRVFKGVHNFSLAPRNNQPIILFGGGYGVKSLIPWSAKELGKISIDVGSVLDAWSGYQSRHMFLEDRFKHLVWVK